MKKIYLIFILALLLFLNNVHAEIISDTNGPIVTDAVCDKQNQTLKPGDKVKFSFKASDPSGLNNNISVNFYEATSYKGREFNWTYNEATQKYEATFTIPNDVQNGEYYISTIYVYDIYNNQTAYSTHLGYCVGVCNQTVNNSSNNSIRNDTETINNNEKQNNSASLNYNDNNDINNTKTDTQSKNNKNSTSVNENYDNINNENKDNKILNDNNDNKFSSESNNVNNYKNKIGNILPYVISCIILVAFSFIIVIPRVFKKK